MAPYTGLRDHYKPLIRKGAPSLAAQRLGSYMLTRIGEKSVLVVKSELHLNPDGVATGGGDGHPAGGRLLHGRSSTRRSRGW